MQKPRYDTEGEEALMARLWSPEIKDDPEAFVMLVFPWGEVGTPLERFAGPRRWQRRVLRGVKARVAANRANETLGLDLDVSQIARVSGRGIGKSALVSWLILWMLSTRIGSTVIVSANTEHQLRTVTWGELGKWVALAVNAHWWELSATKLSPAAWIATAVERDLQKGTRYWAAEGKLWSEENPDGYAGAHNMDGMMVIFDEASGIPDSIWAVASGFFTEKIVDRYWFAFSNGRRNEGYFYECFGLKAAFWDTDAIDARSVEGADIAYYQKIIEEYGEDSNEAKVEVYGQFPATGDGQFITPALVDSAMKRPRYKDTTAPVVMGVDPARGGADTTSIVVRRGRDLDPIRRFKGDDTMTVVGHVIEIYRDVHPQLIVIDEGGLGYGILDRLKEQGYPVRGVNFGWKSSKPQMWGNKRAQMWGDMAQWIRTASIPNDRQLKAQLVSVKTKPDSAGRIFLLGKKEMRAAGFPSPDDADALAVTFAFPLMHDGDEDSPRRLIDRDRGAGYADQSTPNSWMGA